MNKLEEKNKLEEIHKCPICLELAKNPYILPCKHLFCKECLDELIDFSRNECAKVKCSLCDKVHKVENDIKQWKAPIALSQTIDVLNVKKQKQLQKNTICCCMDRCQETEDMFYFVDKQCYICYKCKKKTETRFGKFYHMRFSEKKNIVSAFCKVHDSFHDEYCFTCKLLCCKYCQVLKHNNLVTKSLATRWNQIDITSIQLQKNIETDISEMKSKLGNMNEEKMKWKKIIHELKTKCLFQCCYVLNLLSEEMNNNLDNLFDVYETQGKKSDNKAHQNLKELEKIKMILEKSHSENPIERLINWENVEKHTDAGAVRVKVKTPHELTLHQREEKLEQNDGRLYGILQAKMDSILYQNEFENNTEATLLKKQGLKLKWKPKKDYDLCMNDPMEMQKFLKNNFEKVLFDQRSFDCQTCNSDEINITNETAQHQTTHNNISKEDPQHQASHSKITKEDPQHQTSHSKKTKVDPQNQSSQNKITKGYPQHQTSQNKMNKVDPQHQTSLNKIIKEYPQHQTSLNKITKEYPHHQTSHNKITKEYPQHQTSQNKITNECPQNQTSHNKITKEYPQHQTSQNKITKEYPQNQTSHNKITKEYPQHQTSHNKITKEDPQHQTSQNKITKEYPQHQTSHNKITNEYPQHQTSQNNITKEYPQHQTSHNKITDALAGDNALTIKNITNELFQDNMNNKDIVEAEADIIVQNKSGKSMQVNMAACFNSTVKDREPQLVEENAQLTDDLTSDLLLQENKRQVRCRGGKKVKDDEEGSGSLDTTDHHIEEAQKSNNDLVVHNNTAIDEKQASNNTVGSHDITCKMSTGVPDSAVCKKPSLIHPLLCDLIENSNQATNTMSSQSTLKVSEDNLPCNSAKEARKKNNRRRRTCKKYNHTVEGDMSSGSSSKSANKNDKPKDHQQKNGRHFRRQPRSNPQQISKDDAQQNATGHVEKIPKSDQTKR